jgi:hypothetical protein
MKERCVTFLFPIATPFSEFELFLQAERAFEQAALFSRITHGEADVTYDTQGERHPHDFLQANRRPPLILDGSGRVE